MGNRSGTVAIKFTEPPCLVADLIAEQALRPVLDWLFPPCDPRLNLTFVPGTKKLFLDLAHQNLNKLRNTSVVSSGVFH